MCINYTNERFQQYFVDVMLLKEKKWYDSQGLDIPFIPFFDNSHIIGRKLNITLKSKQNLFKISFTAIHKNIYLVQYYAFPLQILDLFHHKSRGIFSILNDECKLQNPSMQNFGSNLKNSWEKAETSITWNFRGQHSETTFLIRHFASEVRYSTVCSGINC